MSDFFWSMLSVDVDIEEDANEVFVNIIDMWLTIRGFSIVGSLYWRNIKDCKNKYKQNQQSA